MSNDCSAYKCNDLSKSKIVLKSNFIKSNQQ